MGTCFSDAAVLMSKGNFTFKLCWQLSKSWPCCLCLQSTQQLPANSGKHCGSLATSRVVLFLFFSPERLIRCFTLEPVCRCPVVKHFSC